MVDYKDPTDTLSWKLRELWQKVSLPFRRLKYSIGSLIRWFPVIWSDRQWDHMYFYVVLERKLELMIKDFTKYSNHLHVDKEIRHMVICKNLCTRLLNDDYARYHYDKLDRMYGELNMTFTPIENSKCSRIHINRKNESPMCGRLSKKYWRLAATLRNYDRELLFKLFYKHIDAWWW